MSNKSTLRSFIALLIGMLLSILFFKIVTELIKVSTSSMSPTIEANNYVWINKLKPGPRLFSNNPNYYNRISTSKKIKRDDIIVFNFPDADTICSDRPSESYYLLKRTDKINSPNTENTDKKQLKPLKVWQRPRMIKRIIALPGEQILIKKGQIYINDSIVEEKNHSNIIALKWTGDTILLNKLLSTNTNIKHVRECNMHILYIHKNLIGELNNYKPHFTTNIISANVYDKNVFPFSINRRWNAYNMGPILIPQKGVTIKLTPENFDIYKRVVQVFENENIIQKGNYLFHNNIPISKYTFKMDYYWVQGDNQPQSFDSRYWGFVPENHILGTVKK